MDANPHGTNLCTNRIHKRNKLFEVILDNGIGNHIKQMRSNIEKKLQRSTASSSTKNNPDK